MDVAQILQSFGFTEVEARVYLQLCAGAPATGYELAKALQASRANVYNALEGLAAKGAAEKTPTPPVRYAPVHPDDLVARLSARTMASLDALRAELPRPAQPKPDEFWVVTGTDAILDKAVEVICGAQRTVVADLWSEEAAVLTPALEAAQQRGIQVTLIVVGPVETTLRRVYHQGHPEEWAVSGRSLTIVADGMRVLVGAIGRRAICTADPTLVQLADDGLFHGMLVLEMQRRLGLSDDDLMEIERAMLGGV